MKENKLNCRVKEMEYNFEVIDREQTPAVPAINGGIDKYMDNNREELFRFTRYASELKHCDMTPIGLAANQVNFNGERFMQRAFATADLSTGYGWQLIVDPKIIKYIGWKELKSEGCLTWPGMMIIAERSRRIKVVYYDVIDKEYKTQIFSGLEAQVWQHEVNHLNGVKEVVKEKDWPMPTPLKPGRNEECPCSSGVKYKHCCML